MKYSKQVGQRPKNPGVQSYLIADLRFSETSGGRRRERFG
jgi:hypothetical protein